MEIKTYLTKKKTTIFYKEEDGKLIEKQCTKCLLWQGISEFTNSPSSALGKSNACNKCESIRFTALSRSRGVPPKKPLVIIENDIAKRQCTKCELVKELEAFDRNFSGYLDHDSECSECKRRRGELYRRNKGIRPHREVPILTDISGNPTHRECSRCQKMLPLDEFHKHNGGTAFLNRHPYCKTCSSERHLIHKYGLTLADKTRMHQEQDGSCAICRELVALEDIHVDHCHTSGKVRGLLCGACNKALGLLKDDPKRCMFMMRYLSEPVGNAQPVKSQTGQTL